MVSLSPVFLPPPPHAARSLALPPATAAAEAARVNQIRHLSVTHTKREIVAAPIVTCSLRLPSHIGSDGVTVFFFCRECWWGGRVGGRGPRTAPPFSSPEEVLWGVNLPRAVLLQARRSTIISQSRWKGASELLPPLLPHPHSPTSPPPPSSVSPYCWNLV